MLEKDIEERQFIQDEFQRNFRYSFQKMIKEKNCEEFIFLCVGTDRILGDCFGPLVGSKLNDLLKEDNYSNINVYGTLEQNINYRNLNEILKKTNKNSGIIVIDAALSNKENVGKIFVSNKKTVLGKGLSKYKISIGDISVKASVARDYKISSYNFNSLQNISLSIIMTMANIVSEGIYNFLKQKY